MTPEALPREVRRLLSSLLRLRGVNQADCGIHNLESVTAEDLRFVDYAQLPIGALLRTGGGLEGEALLDISFRLQRTPTGWRSLEFVAWWVKDQARAGEVLQLRPTASPPVAGATVQLGHTLEFHIDVFRLNAGTGLQPHLDKLDELARDFERAVTIYNGLLRERGVPPLTRGKK
jgi:hypothetical protein